MKAATAKITRRKYKTYRDSKSCLTNVNLIGTPFSQLLTNRF
jgi:hypothetical protein